MCPLTITLRNYNMWVCVNRSPKRRCWENEKCNKMSRKLKTTCIKAFIADYENGLKG